MAFYVLLLKESENETDVIYRFGPDEAKLGRLSLDKGSGAVKELESTPTADSEALFTRAAVKVRKYWKNGIFPDRGCWAS